MHNKTNTCLIYVAASLLLCGSVHAGPNAAAAAPLAEGQTFLKLRPQHTQPAACTPQTKGLVAMTDFANLCTCNGTTWLLVGAQAACVWSLTEE